MQDEILDEYMSAQSQEELPVFDQIVSEQLSHDVIYEDDIALAYRVINPVRKDDFIVIPKDK